MNNNKQSSIEQFAIALYENGFLEGNGDEIDDLLVYFKAMEKKQTVDFALNYAFGNNPTSRELRDNCEKLFDEYYRE